MSVSLTEACCDPGIFNVPLWPAQRDLLESVEAGPRTHVWALGRRASKTTLCALIALHNALFRRDLDGLVRPGETRFAMVVATNIQQSRVLLRMCAAIVERSPLLASMLVAQNEDELRFRLPGGARTAVRAMPCSSRGIRGYAVSCAVLDEVAHFMSEGEVGSAATADRVFEALMPAIAQFGDAGRMMLISTPYGDQGLFARLFHGGLDGSVPGVAVRHAASAAVNPTLTAGVLAQERARDPDSFEQELEARFLSPGDTYLDFDRIVVADRPPLVPGLVREDSGALPVAGLDPSFASDPFGIVVLARDRGWPGRLLVARAVSVGGRGREFDGTMRRVAEVLRGYGVRRVVTDQYSSAAVIARLRSDGFALVVHTVSAASKTAAYAEVRTRLYNDGLELYGREPGGPDLVGELRRLRTRFSVGSANVYSPRVAGSHGDLASALSVVVHDQRLVSAGGNRRGRSGGRTVAQDMVKGGV